MKTQCLYNWSWVLTNAVDFIFYPVYTDLIFHELFNMVDGYGKNEVPIEPDIPPNLCSTYERLTWSRCKEYLPMVKPTELCILLVFMFCNLSIYIELSSYQATYVLFTIIIINLWYSSISSLIWFLLNVLLSGSTDVKHIDIDMTAVHFYT